MIGHHFVNRKGVVFRVVELAHYSPQGNELFRAIYPDGSGVPIFDDGTQNVSDEPLVIYTRTNTTYWARGITNFLQKFTEVAYQVEVF
jgi:hypothetical protein